MAELKQNLNPDAAAAAPADEAENAIYEWQIPVEGFGLEGQRKLRGATVLVSRCGGLGGNVAYQLAAAGVGKLILAHAGVVRPSDLNRQILMTHDWLGRPRVESAARRLKELNPRLEVEEVAENVNSSNAGSLAATADLIVDCAPLFEERYALNQAAVARRIPMVEAAVYGLEAHLTTILPGKSACLRCLYPEQSATWRRRFPVFGAVSATVGGMAAMEAVKLLAGFGDSLAGRLLVFDLRSFAFRTYRTRKIASCPECGTT